MKAIKFTIAMDNETKTISGILNNSNIILIGTLRSTKGIHNIIVRTIPAIKEIIGIKNIHFKGILKNSS